MSKCVRIFVPSKEFGIELAQCFFGVLARGDIFGQRRDAIDFARCIADRKSASPYLAQAAVWSDNAVLFAERDAAILVLNRLQNSLFVFWMHRIEERSGILV